MINKFKSYCKIKIYDKKYCLGDILLHYSFFIFTIGSPPILGIEIYRFFQMGIIEDIRRKS